MVDITNGQALPASLDVFDQKNKPITALPAGATASFSSSNDQIAQWRSGHRDENDVFVADAASLSGEVTTEHDDVGPATITGLITWADGTTKSGALEVNVTNSAPGEVRFTAGVPRGE